MTFRQFLLIIPRLVKYNMKIIFAGKFFWFLLAAFGFFAFFMFNHTWNRREINEDSLYSMLLFPSLLLIFYPAVFGIQNDEDSRILEILFGIPDYRYKVWGVRLFMIYAIVFAILLLFSAIGYYLLYPINIIEISVQLMFPVLFFGNMAFMFSTIIRSGNGTAVIMIIMGIFLIFYFNNGDRINSFWNVFLNPLSIPGGMHPMTWDSILLKNRIFLIVGSIIWSLIGLLNLQKREKFI